ncbi:S41 family peptidase [Winogradskyella sp.]|uniref:S41 family peptidase n=1 Tax=Winogradskyella sp. TaxID=1883156 RepID=UPI002616EF80|nr:S41 family peptidase [Winogradskyella sp.]
MKRVYASLLILLFTFACKKSKAQDEPIKNNTINSSLLIKDLDTLKHWITKAHGDPYRFTTPKNLNDQFEKARQEVIRKQSISGNEFAGIVMPIIAELRDGHAQVFLPNLNDIKGNLIFPVKYIFVNKKPYVIKNMSSEDIEIGSEILEINGQNTSVFFNKIIPILHRDGDIETIRYRRLQNQLYFTRVLMALGKASKVYSIKYKNKKGQILSSSLDGLSYTEYIESSAQKREKIKPMHYAKIDTLKNTALLAIKSLNPGYYQKGEFYKQIDSIINTINRDMISNLIIDLRSNIGGEDSYIMYLLRYLLDKEFTVNSEITFRQNNYKFLPDGKHWDIAPNCFKKNEKGTYDATEHLWEDHCTLGSFKPFDERFKGRVVVLINAFTFSAAADLASMLYYKERAVFVGEETGGSSIGNVSGYIPTLDLPNSKVKVNLPLISLKNPYFSSKFNNHGVIPNYKVEPTVNSILSEKDEVLIKAISLIK